LAALGGVGAFYATLLHGATPSLFTMDQLLLLLAMVVVGGIGTAEGAVVGTLIIVLFDKVFIGLGPIRLILIAGIKLVTVLFLRGGLFGIPAQYFAWRGRRRSERRGRHSSKGGEVMAEEAIEIVDKLSYPAMLGTVEGLRVRALSCAEPPPKQRKRCSLGRNQWRYLMNLPMSARPNWRCAYDVASFHQLRSSRRSSLVSRRETQALTRSCISALTTHAGRPSKVNRRSSAARPLGHSMAYQLRSRTYSISSQAG
jgi:hypothetical protein